MRTTRTGGRRRRRAADCSPPLSDAAPRSLAIATKDSIPPFGPEITRKRYPRNQTFRDLLLAKRAWGAAALRWRDGVVLVTPHRQ